MEVTLKRMQSQTDIGINRTPTNLIAAYEKQVEQTILKGVQVILPEFVASIEHIDVHCEAAISNLLLQRPPGIAEKD